MIDKDELRSLGTCVKSGTGILPVDCMDAGTRGNKKIRRAWAIPQRMGKMPMPQQDRFSHTLLERLSNQGDTPIRRSPHGR